MMMMINLTWLSPLKSFFWCYFFDMWVSIFYDSIHKKFRSKIMIWTVDDDRGIERKEKFLSITVEGRRIIDIHSCHYSIYFPQWFQTKKSISCKILSDSLFFYSWLVILRSTFFFMNVFRLRQENILLRLSIFMRLRTIWILLLR
jgi:hypothetical protein